MCTLHCVLKSVTTSFHLLQIAVMLWVGAMIFHAFLLLWPWPWHDNLHVRNWPDHSEDVTVYQKWTF